MLHHDIARAPSAAAPPLFAASVTHPAAAPGSSAKTRRDPSAKDPVMRRALVYGWGRSGRAVAQLLAEEGIEVLAVDDRSRPEGRVPVRSLLSDEVHELPAVDVVVPSPGVPLGRPLLQQAFAEQVPVLGELELAARRADGDLLCITGSNGKSTTTELVGALLRSLGHRPDVCGNIGLPLSEAVLSRREQGVDDGEPFVVEVSSFQLETVDQLSPRVAALLNLSADHLDRHGDLDAYLEIKRRLFRRQGAGDVAVLNAEDPRSAQTPVAPGVRRRLFARTGAVTDGTRLVNEGGALRIEPGGLEVGTRDDLRLRGEHNLENVLAALAIVDSWHTCTAEDAAKLRGALSEFSGLTHRLQWVARRCGMDWYDDSKGTNVGATAKSLAGFPERSVLLILGGTAKGQDFAPLRPVVEARAAAVLLIGEAGDEIAQALEGAASIVRCGTLEQAVAEAVSQAASRYQVVLSPACASFDQFRDYADRGESFQRLVLQLPGDRREGGRG